MKNLYKEYQNKKKLLNCTSILLLSNGKEYLTINEDAELISKKFTTNLIAQSEYKFTVFGEEKFLEILKQLIKQDYIIVISYLDFNMLENITKR